MIKSLSVLLVALAPFGQPSSWLQSRLSKINLLDLGIVTIDNRFIVVDAKLSSSVKVMCGVVKSSSSRMGYSSMGDDLTSEIKDPVDGVIELEVSDRYIHVSTQSVVPCHVKAFVMFNDTTYSSLAHFPMNNFAEGCYDKNLMSIDHQHVAVIDKLYASVANSQGGSQSWSPRPAIQSAVFSCVKASNAENQTDRSRSEL